MTKTRSPRRFTLLLALPIVLFAASQLASAASAAKPPKGPPPTLTGTITMSNQTWVCKGPVNLTSVNVTIANAARTDAIHLESGCTGRIGQINVVQYSADAVKVAQGAHDLTVGGGTITCLAKAPRMHQDGVQVMGGSKITFSNMAINCGRQADTLMDSNFFVNEAGKSTTPPSDVVCDHCTLGGWTAHTANVETSLRSGLTNSTLCVGRYPKLTLTVGAAAVSPVLNGNTIDTC